MKYDKHSAKCELLHGSWCRESFVKNPTRDLGMSIDHPVPNGYYCWVNDHFQDLPHGYQYLPHEEIYSPRDNMEVQRENSEDIQVCMGGAYFRRQDGPCRILTRCDSARVSLHLLTGRRSRLVSGCGESRRY